MHDSVVELQLLQLAPSTLPLQLGILLLQSLQLLSDLLTNAHLPSQRCLLHCRISSGACILVQQRLQFLTWS